MSIRRRLINAVCLLSLGSSAVVGQQQKDAFNEWERPQKKTESSAQPVAQNRPAVGSRASRTEYFSPSGGAAATGSAVVKGTPAPAASEETAAETATPLIRERLRTSVAPAAAPSASGPNAAAASPATAMATAVPPATKPETATVKGPGAAAQPTAAITWPAAFNTQSAQVPLAEATPEKSPIPSGQIRQADFVKGSGEQKNVVPVAASESTATSANAGNPFEELLQGAGGATAGEASFSGNSAAEPLELSVSPADSADLPAGPPAGSSTSGGQETLAGSEDFGPQSPGVTLEWIRHGEFNVGQTCQLDLVVHNSSRSTVRSVMTEAVIPAELEVLSVSPAPLAGASAPSWTFGELRAGEKRTVTMQVVPRHRGDMRLSAFVRLTGFTASAFTVQEPMVGIAVSGPAEMEVGQQVSYVVRVNNPGTGVASNVLIQAVVPDGLEHRRGSLLTIEIGTLNPGESRQAQLSLTAVRGGAHQMAVRVVADGGLSDQSMTTVSIAEPRLDLQIAGPAGQMAGRTDNYGLKVVNAGSVPSANVRAKYRVPDGFTFVSADRGGKYNDVDRSIEWFVGTVQPGESSQFQVSLRADQTGKLLHQAGLISEHGKVTMAEHTTSVEGTAVLDLKIAANRTQLKVGDEVTYEIRVANTGSRAAAGVGMSCELPSGVELQQAAGPSEYIAENGVMVFKSLPQIEAGKTAVFAVKVRCTREGIHRLRLRVASESISEPLIGEESSTVNAR